MAGQARFASFGVIGHKAPMRRMLMTWLKTGALALLVLLSAGNAMAAGYDLGLDTNAELALVCVDQPCPDDDASGTDDCAACCHHHHVSHPSLTSSTATGWAGYLAYGASPLSAVPLSLIRTEPDPPRA
jgi:hypothetical protein